MHFVDTYNPIYSLNASAFSAAWTTLTSSLQKEKFTVLCGAGYKYDLFFHFVKLPVDQAAALPLNQFPVLDPQPRSHKNESIKINLNSK